MDKDRYDYFIAAYECDTFSEAARQIPLSPQGFSKAITALQKDLGVPLFIQDNTGRRVPTQYADELYAFAKRRVADRNVLLNFDEIRSTSRTVVRLGASIGTVGLLGANVIQEFERFALDATVEIFEVPDYECDDLLRDGLCDVSLCIYPALKDRVTYPFYESAVEVWVHASDEFFNRDFLTLEDVAQRHLAWPGLSFKCWEGIRSAIRQACHTEADLIPFSEIFWIYDMVQRGCGLGFTLPHLRSLPVFSQDSCVKALPLCGQNWKCGVSHLHDREIKPPVQKLIDFLKQKGMSLKRR